MSPLGPFTNNQWDWSVQNRTRAKLEARHDDNSFDQVAWEIGLVLASALGAAAFIEEILRFLHVS